MIVVSDYLISDIFAKTTGLNNAAKVWAKDGNLIVNIFQWLFEGIMVDHKHKDGIAKLIDGEFQMFCHHQRLVNSYSNRR